MRSSLRTIIAFCLGVFVHGIPLANSSTYYARATAQSTGAGKVYVSTSAEQPATEAYKTEVSADGQGTSTDFKFYLYALPDEGKMLDYWEKDGTNLGQCTSVTIKAESTKSDSPTTAVYSAVFTDAAAVTVKSNDTAWGSVSISDRYNKIGSEVTLSASIPVVPAYGCKNTAVKFAGWYDQDGNLLSVDPKYTFTVEKSMEVTGRFKNAELADGGFYRIRSSFNRVLTVDGNYKMSFSNNDLTGLLSWTLPTGYVAADFNQKNFSNDTDPTEVETMPSTIIQLKGVMKDGELTEADLLSQGASTKAMAGQTCTLRRSSGFPCYYEIVQGSYSIKHGNADNNGVRVQGGQNKQNAYQWMSFQAINEDTVDDYWFGAHPDESMAYDGGYWASMYTSFPYKCYEPDGVEAYYVKECRTYGDAVYAQLVKIESGIVPAETPVLLKCKSFASSKDNRLIPLDASLYDINSIEDNLLVGEYQLNSSADGDGHKLFDPSAMRVLGADADGVAGFYSMEQGESGEWPELERNKVYLDLSKVGADVRDMPVYISTAVDENEEADATVTDETPAIKGYFRIQNLAGKTDDKAYIQITGPFTARPDQTVAQALTEPGSVIYVEAVAEDVNGESCYRIKSMRSQGIDLCGEVESDFMGMFNDILNGANKDPESVAYGGQAEEILWSMVRRGFNSGYTCVGRAMIEAMITLVATRLEDEPGVTRGSLEAFAKRFADEVANKINLSFYMRHAADGSYQIFYDVPNLSCVSDWYLKEENKETFEVGMRAMRNYLENKGGIATGEYFDPAEIKEMQGWGYDVTAKYTPDVNGIVSTPYETIFADPDLLFNWLKLNMIKFMDPERCPKITLKGFYLPDVGVELRKHYLTNMLINYFPDIKTDHRYFITTGKSDETRGLLDFANEEHAGQLGDYSCWLLKPVTDQPEACFYFNPVASDESGIYYASVYTDFPMKAVDPTVTKFYTLEESTKTATVSDVEIIYYDIVEIEGTVPRQTPVLVEMTTDDGSHHLIVPDCEVILPEVAETPDGFEVSDRVTAIQRAPRYAVDVKTHDFYGVLLDTPLSPVGFSLRWDKYYRPAENPVHLLSRNSYAGTQPGLWYDAKDSGTIPANTAFLIQPSTSLNAFKVKMPKPDVPSAIENIEESASAEAVEIYDLQGRRVVNPLSGHIYIIGGKKVLVK